MKIIFHNSKSYKFISLLIVLNIIVSAFVICFSYGIYQNFNVFIDEGESAQRELYIRLTSNDGVEQTSDIEKNVFTFYFTFNGKTYIVTRSAFMPCVPCLLKIYMHEK